MPKPNLSLNETNPKTMTYTKDARRWTGLPLLFLTGPVEITNRRIVTIQQETATKKLVAVPGVIAIAAHTIICIGVLEQAGQTGLSGSESATGQLFNEGDLVTVLASYDDVYMIDIDAANAPANGLATCRVDNLGRLTSVVASGTIGEYLGSVWDGIGGLELKNQLLTDNRFTRLIATPAS